MSRGKRMDLKNKNSIETKLTWSNELQEMGEDAEVCTCGRVGVNHRQVVLEGKGREGKGREGRKEGRLSKGWDDNNLYWLAINYCH